MGHPVTVGVIRWPSAGDTAGYKVCRPKLTPVSWISIAGLHFSQHDVNACNVCCCRRYWFTCLTWYTRDGRCTALVCNQLPCIFYMILVLLWFCVLVCVDNLLLLFWHAPLGVRSTIRRHQPPRSTVLGQVDCFLQCEVVGSQITLDDVQPHDSRTPWWSSGCLMIANQNF